MEEKENFINQLWLYIGRQELSNKRGVIVNRFIPIVNNEKSDTYVGYQLKRSDLIIGGIYEVPVNETEKGTIILPSGLKFIRLYQDEEIIKEYKLAERLFMEKQKDDRIIKKYQKDGKFEMPNNLAEVQKIYRKLRGTERRYFMAVLEKALEYQDFK